jgi:type I pantothenate kinase
MKSLISPYLEFSRDTWRGFRANTPLTLTDEDLLQLKGQNEPVSMTEVEEIYLPLSRLINLYAQATQDLYKVTTRFLGHPEPKVPYIIAIAGSVAVGKSTTSRILQALLSRWSNHPKVVLVTTDGYLYPTEVLETQNLMSRKGFPESYNLTALIEFLADLKAGKRNLKVPLYSHHHYNTLTNTYQTVDQPDIVILEGLNVLQIPPASNKTAQWFVSDFFDFTIYVDAEISLIKQWYLDRFLLFRQLATHDPSAFFYQFSKMNLEEALAFANNIWTNINERNLLQNILPFKNRARLILEKGPDHFISKVFLRKI